MSFNSYEELMQAVEDRRKEDLTLEIDMGSEYSPEYENAKSELEKARAVGMLTGGQGFLSNNIDKLEEEVERLRPEPNSVWVKFRRLNLGEWTALLKKAGANPFDQYEQVLPKTFIGVFGKDPGVSGEHSEAVEPLSTDAELLSTRSDKSILPGGMLHQVVQAFMAWQNSGGEVSIRPTKSGRD